MSLVERPRYRLRKIDERPCFFMPNLDRVITLSLPIFSKNLIVRTRVPPDSQHWSDGREISRSGILRDRGSLSRESIRSWTRLVVGRLVCLGYRSLAYNGAN